MLISAIFLLSFALDATVAKVVNPVEPGPYTLTFEEDLRFGADEDEDEYIWADAQVVSSFSVAPNGYFYIADVKNVRVLEFDDQGKFKQVIAGKGQGPGEYQFLQRFQILGDGSMVGFNTLQAAGKFHYYDATGKFSSTKTVQDFSTIFYMPDFSPDGQMCYAWYLSADLETGKIQFKTGLFDGELKPVRELSAAPFPTPPSEPAKASDPTFWEDYIGLQFNTIISQGASLARFMPNNDILLANSQGYTIEVWSPGLKEKKLTIVKEYQPKPYTDADRDAIAAYIKDIFFNQAPNLLQVVTDEVIKRGLEKADIPKSKNPITEIVPMEDSHFMTLHQVNFIDGSFVGDLFDGKGTCIGRVDFPGKGVYSFFGLRVQFRNGFVYAMEQNENDENQMVRYRYKLEKK